MTSDRQARLGQLRLEPAELDVDDLGQLVHPQRVEDDRLVDPVEELGEELGLEDLHDRAADPLLVAASRASRAISWLPRFEVMMMTVLRKSTVRPWPSVRRPSSRTWSRTLKTSRCAFSISSSRTTE